jgi:hypothetical protein
MRYPESMAKLFAPSRMRLACAGGEEWPSRTGLWHYSTERLHTELAYSERPQMELLDNDRFGHELASAWP